MRKMKRRMMKKKLLMKLREMKAMRNYLSKIKRMVKMVKSGTNGVMKGDLQPIKTIREKLRTKVFNI